MKAGPTGRKSAVFAERGEEPPAPTSRSYPAKSHMEMKRVVSLGRNPHVHGAAHWGVKALSHEGVRALSLAYRAGGAPERSPALLPVTFTHRAANTAGDKFVCKALQMAKQGSQVSFGCHVSG